MVVIRLARRGAIHQPKYRITVADSRRSPKGKYIEVIGYFNPLVKDLKAAVNLDMEKAKSWIAKGAQPTRRVKSLMAQLEDI